jgi:hypothetical protein
VWGRQGFRSGNRSELYRRSYEAVSSQNMDMA